MIIPDNYIRILHRRTVMREVREYIKTKYAKVDGVAKEPLICPEAPYVDRHVSQDAFFDSIAMFATLEEEETKRLQGWEMNNRNASELVPNSLKTKESHGTEKKATPKTKLKVRRAAEPAPPPPPPADGGEDDDDSGGSGDKH